MNESAIAAQLATTAAIDAPSADNDVATPETEIDHNISTFDSLGALREVMDYFDIQGQARHDANVREQMSKILEYATQNAETKDLTGMLRALRQAEMILGNRVKPDRVSRLYKYVVIQQQKAFLFEKERNLY